jgi:hypothetical protein
MFFRGSLTVTRDWSRAGNAVKIALYRSTGAHQSGAIAQLGERVVRNDEAVGSIPTSSTILAAGGPPWCMEGRVVVANPRVITTERHSQVNVVIVLK